ncbi:MAG TPA: NAD(P)/FAD-dependent oxidoreductase [Candidatus Eisenbacteria bacterium]|jgi:putative flavoprotein involved in K+ transport|nr:NAD(P)/FAD-dependent oxidoreductase [Burkholderiales bacterium]HET9325334.1 NAD(P)/FAD-dependent oxidoreductase [Candidatus Eisenbacteria bacterium]
MTEQQLGSVVIGGSQAGLAVGYHLRQRGLPFVILDENDRVGAAWRNRWDSLRLFTPGRYNGLPGMPFPGSPGAYPTKDETADYLEAYARAFELPVRTGVKVDRLAKTGDRFEVTCGQQALSAENVVVATGAFNNPRVPSFARELDQSIVQLHSKEYRNPSQIQKGAVLVVGAGNSGAEIAMELAPHHQTWLSGPDTGQEPARAGTRLDHLLTPMMWFVATRLTVKTALGRKLRDHFLDPPRGIPLGRVRRKDFAPAGIERVPRMTGVKNGNPILENGRVLEVSNVIWCTGYAPNYNWIDLSLPSHNGLPIHDRGIVDACPGLYFIGLLFLYSLSSALVGGVGRDAEHIVDHIVSTRLSKKDDAAARATTAGRQYA